jgi:hypothetical protein
MGMNSRRREKGRPAQAVLIGVQVILGVACLVGTFAGVTWALSSAAEAPPPLIGFSNAENWPEIKDGVPELLPRSALVPSSGTDVTRLHVFPEPRGSAGSEGEAGSNSSAVSHTHAASLPPSLKSVPKVELGTPAAEALGDEGIAEANGPEPVSEPSERQVRDVGQAQSSSAPVGSAKEAASTPESSTSPTPSTVTAAVAEPPLLAHGSAGVTGITAASSSTLRRVAASPSAGQQKRAERAPRTASDMRPNRTGQETGRRSTVTDKLRPHRPEAKKTRTRTAEVKPSPNPDPPAQAPPAEVKEERVHLLGVPLPTGRKVRECLLEFRC